MKRLLSILSSVDERLVTPDSYVNDNLSYIVENESRAVFVRIGYVFQSMDVSASCSVSHVRNSSTVHKQYKI